MLGTIGLTLLLALAAAVTLFQTQERRAGDYFRKCIDRSGEGIAKKCRANTDA